MAFGGGVGALSWSQVVPRPVSPQPASLPRVRRLTRWSGAPTSLELASAAFPPLLQCVGSVRPSGLPRLPGDGCGPPAFISLRLTTLFYLHSVRSANWSCRHGCHAGPTSKSSPSLRRPLATVGLRMFWDSASAFWHIAVRLLAAAWGFKFILVAVQA